MDAEGDNVLDNLVVVLIITITVIIAVVPTIKHLKGKGDCCGGSDYKPKKKKLKNIVDKKIFKIEGMHCQSCCNRVTEAINDISGVSAKVNLKNQTAQVSYSKNVADETIILAVEKAGYKVIV